jgi:hypothetical protein
MKTETFNSPCESTIIHRDECFVSSLSERIDPIGFPWRAIVRTGNGVMHWEWHRTEDEAQRWVDKWKSVSAT